MGLMLWNRWVVVVGCAALVAGCTARGGGRVVAQLEGGGVAKEHAEAAAGAKSGLGPQGPDILVGLASAGRVRPHLERVPAAEEGLLVVIDTPYEIFEEQGTYIHVGAWQTDGAPAIEASVYIGESEVGRTNAFGSLVFLYPPKGADASILGRHEITVIDKNNPYLQGQVAFSPYMRTASFASDHVYVYTDRGIYRPGESVRVRAIGWHLREDYGPLLDATIDFVLKDDRGEVVAGGQRVTDEFGVTSIDLKLARTVREGLYTLEVGYEQERQTARIQVKEFKTPAISIEHTLGRFFPSYLKELGFDVTLKPGPGGAIEGARVSASAKIGGTERESLSLAVKGQGPHRLVFSEAQITKLKDLLGEGQFLTMTLSVEDSAGRRDSLDREMRFTSNPFTAVLETDKAQYTTGDAVQIMAKLGDLDGAPVRTKDLELRVGKAKFKAQTNASGVARFALVMPAASAQVSLHAEGVKQALAESTLNWVKPREMSSHIAEPVIKERAFASVVVYFPTEVEPISPVVHMDVVDTSGAIVNAVLLHIERVDGKFVARGQFEAPSWGSMLLTFFALGRVRGSVDPGDGSPAHHRIGLLTEGQNLVVEPNKTLTITLGELPASARPGQALAFNAAITNPRGEPVRASVGAAIVDGRIIALKDPLEVTPMDQFYHPALRTMSTTGAQILTWPVVSRNWGAEMDDIALPPFPFHEGGPLVAGYYESGASYGIGSMGAAEMSAEVGGLTMKGSGAGGGGVGQSAERTRQGRGEEPAPVTITVRTRFDETSLWAPNLRADGTVEIKATLPDSISEQEIILIASDAAGGVGVLRRRIEVTTPLYAHADFPRVLRVGESVDVNVFVENRSGASQKLLAQAHGDGLQIDQEERALVIGSGAVAHEVYTVRADKAGTVRYAFKVSNGALEDLVEGSVRVVPAGAPMLETVAGQASEDKPFVASWVIGEQTAGNDAYLNVAFPSITAAFVGIQAFGATLRDTPLSMASDLVSAALLLQYAQRFEVRSKEIEALRERVMSATSGLQFAQHKDGAFAFWRNGATSPYVTAWALEAMLEVVKLDVPVEPHAIERAADWLARNIAGHALISVDDIAFWQGDSAAVRLGLTAQVFDVLTRVPEELRTSHVQEAIRELAAFYKDYLLTQSSPEPLTAGHALMGLGRLGLIDAEQTQLIVQNMVERRDRGHWEPSWFHAYGGRIEATVAVVGALHQINPNGFHAEKRDALNYILSTRDAWGSWHNERGTAAAIRALLLVGQPGEQARATVTVTLDGHVIKQVELDPADPFGSTIALSHLDLGQNLSAGRHEVEVKYDGKLSPSVVLASRTWVVPAPAKARSAGFGLWLEGPKTVRSGEPVDLTVRFANHRSRGQASVLITPSGLLEVDFARLEALVLVGEVLASYRVSDRGLELDIRPGFDAAEFVVPFQAVRSGRAALPAVVFRGSDLVRTAGGKELVVSR
ncbi:MAG: hypothetical protein H0U74_21655 [Bradymonadaceae bacterium]|nr:hypothetical protein [Lujinxingiaceae bacterium]